MENKMKELSSPSSANTDLDRKMSKNRSIVSAEKSRPDPSSLAQYREQEYCSKPYEYESLPHLFSLIFKFKKSVAFSQIHADPGPLPLLSQFNKPSSLFSNSQFPNNKTPKPSFSPLPSQTLRFGYLIQIQIQIQIQDDVVSTFRQRQDRGSSEPLQGRRGRR